MNVFTNKACIRFAYLAVLVLAGAGCMNGRTTYVKSPETANVVVEPNAEGARASTGGAEATVTPQLPTEQIIRAFPAIKEATMSEPVELKKPVPLPDGTRSEYVIVSRDYSIASNDGTKQVYNVIVTDTRGIPALSAYIQSYSAYETDEGFRRKIASPPDRSVWLTYAYGPKRESDGAGNILMNFRNRFLIQIEGGDGVSVNDLTAFAETLNLDALR